MPTGFTAAVADGTITELRDYILQCARGMGALVDMRDALHGAPIPERFEPHTEYYDGQIEQAKARLVELQRMTAVEREAACAAYNEDIERRRREAIERNALLRRRYAAMIDQVEDWTGAPEGIKEFALEQLRTSRDFDVQGDPTEWLPKVTSVDAWYAEQVHEATRTFARATESRNAEIKRTEERNTWLAQLRASLPPATTNSEQDTGAAWRDGN